MLSFTKKNLILLIPALFIFRLIYGLCSEFWSPDELQIYLIGLKSYTTGTWPLYGPDVVYTNTQIPGALQGLLVGAAFYISKLPELPTILLNVLSFASLSLMAYYITRRVKGIPAWMVWMLVMTTPWTLHYSTRVVNPSYALVFSIPFYIALLEILPISKDKFIPAKLAYLIIGITTTMTMQLHLSWVLLLPYTMIALGYSFRSSGWKKTSVFFLLYIGGLILGMATLIPTLLNPDVQAGKVGSNIVFNWSNFGNIVTILTRYLSFAAYEIPYVLGSSEEHREILKGQLWMIPFTFILLLVGFLQVGLFIISFFVRSQNEEWKKMKWLILFSYIMLFFSFFFSIKGPSPHTFYLTLPLPLIYSFYCYEWLVSKKAVVLTFLKVILVCGLFFHIGFGIFKYQNRSLYKDRNKVVEALDKMNYKVLGERRADEWGYGY
jgi:hypothetical protein